MYSGNSEMSEKKRKKTTALEETLQITEAVTYMC